MLQQHTSLRLPCIAAPVRLPMQRHVCAAARRIAAARIGRLAVGSLYAELALYPKPGLVSFVDSGSHDDMDARTFMRSLFALRGYFRRMAEAGISGYPFAALKRLGMLAEKKMLKATGGVNTHRGAIFCVGLLCAAIGACWHERVALTGRAIRETLLEKYGDSLMQHLHTGRHLDSNGVRVKQRHGAGGAREEAALGMPSVFDVGLPALQATLASGRGRECASVDALFALMAHTSDSNVYHRGGVTGAELVRQQAQRFLAQGGSAHPGWRGFALECHREFVAHRLSPGGAADLLAATLLVEQAMHQFNYGIRDRR